MTSITLLYGIFFFLALLFGLSESKSESRISLSIIALGLACWSSGFEWSQSLASALFFGLFVGKMLSCIEIREQAEELRSGDYSRVAEKAREPLYDIDRLWKLLLESTRPKEGERVGDWNEALAAFLKKHSPELVEEVAWSGSPSYVTYQILNVMERHLGRKRLKELEDLLQSQSPPDSES